MSLYSSKSRICHNASYSMPLNYSRKRRRDENRIDDVAASATFQMEEPALDASPFRRHESVNLALMPFSRRTGLSIFRWAADLAEAAVQ